MTQTTGPEWACLADAMDQVDEGIVDSVTVTHFEANFGFPEEWIVRWVCIDKVAREAVFNKKAEALSFLSRLGYAV